MKSNRLGDSYSKKESLSILEGMCKGSDAPVKQLKERVEGLYSGSMASATTRYRKSVANRSNIFGIGHFVDNIGLVSINIHPHLECYLQLFRQLFHVSTRASRMQTSTCK